MKLLSTEDRKKYEAKVALYEALGFPALVPVVKKLRAWLAADQARRQATTSR